MGDYDAERQAAAAAARMLLPHMDVPAVRRAFEKTLSPAERRHLDQLRRRYGGVS
jgi:sirohydrochlorin ferrochelatase